MLECFGYVYIDIHNYSYYTHLTAFFPGQPGIRKAEPVGIFMKQEMMW